MKNRVIILILVLVAVLGGAYYLYDILSSRVDADQISFDRGPAKTEQEVSEDPGNDTAAEEKAPDFTVLDADGNKVNLSSLFGQPIVLNFWASWCGPCQSEMPEFNDAYSELKGKVLFVMVDLTDGSRETVDVAKAFIRQKGFSFPVYFDTMSDAADTYGITAIPTTYFIDSRGRIAAKAVGMIDRESLDKGIAMITD